jgi:hypothetical protein
MGATRAREVASLRALAVGKAILRERRNMGILLEYFPPVQPCYTRRRMDANHAGFSGVRRFKLRFPHHRY